MVTTTTSTTSTTATTAASTASTTTASTAATTNSALGQSILSSLNASGDNIDTDTLITQLTAAQQSAVETPITTKQTANTAQISSAGTIASDLTTFSQSLNTLITGGTLQTQPVSSDSSTVAVAAIAGTPIGALSSSITVSALAQAQTLESQPIPTGTTYSSGTVTIATTGGASLTLTAGTDFTDPASLASAINLRGSATGVTASIVTDGSGSHLVLKGQTGAAQAFSITTPANSDGSASALAGFAYTPPTDANGNPTANTSSPNVATGSGMQRAQMAQDAAFTVDGIAYTRSGNTVSDAVQGVTLTLAKTGTVGLSATRPTAAITEAVNDFVSAYNSLITEVNTATATATSGGTAGPLAGNSAMRSLKSQLSQLTTTPLNASGSIRTLAELGVSTAQDGTLSVNSSTLSNMLTQYPDDVEAMFETSQSSSAPGVIITSAAGAASSGVFTVSGITSAPVGGNASGSINGVPATAKSWILTAASGSGANGLSLQILSSAPSSATVTINQGLGGALQAVNDMLLGTTGALTTLQSSLTTQQTSLAAELTKADAQVTVYHDQLVTKFGQMTTLVSGYKATQSYLTQEVDLWTNSGTSNS